MYSQQHSIHIHTHTSLAMSIALIASESPESFCLNLIERCTQSPGYVYLRLPQLVENVLSALRDGRAETRELAARAVQGCLAVCNERDAEMAARWHARFLEEAVTTLNMGRADGNAAHGALLVLAELLLDANQNRALDDRQLEQAFDGVWAHRESRHRHLRMAMLALLPRLAAAAPPPLSAQWLPRLASHLLASLHGGQEQRAEASWLASSPTRSGPT